MTPLGGETDEANKVQRIWEVSEGLWHVVEMWKEHGYSRALELPRAGRNFRDSLLRNRIKKSTVNRNGSQTFEIPGSV